MLKRTKTSRTTLILATVAVATLVAAGVADVEKEPSSYSFDYEFALARYLR